MARDKLSRNERYELTDEAMVEAATLDDDVFNHVMSDPLTEDEFKLAMYRLGGICKLPQVMEYVTTKRRLRLQETIDSLVKKGYIKQNGKRITITEKGAAYYEKVVAETRRGKN